MHPDLSTESKQTFQIVSLLATILVVGIHYKTDLPETANAFDATLNQLLQEFWFGGIARVAVPLFAFAAGLFWYRSDNGTVASWLKKLRKRTRTVLVPLLIVSGLAMACWVAVRILEHHPIEQSMLSLVEMGLLNPPAIQLWFLRDLLVLMILSPAFRFLIDHPILRTPWLTFVSLAWLLNLPIFPQVGGLYLIHNETLLFFQLGCLATRYPQFIERIIAAPTKIMVCTIVAWMILVGARIAIKADFNIWYTQQHCWVDLLIHQCSIVCGCTAVFMLARRLRTPRLLWISGASFFVYLFHEFPLRVLVAKVAAQIAGQPLGCWVAVPLVLAICFGAAILLDRFWPKLFQILTGGRTLGRRST